MKPKALIKRQVLLATVFAFLVAAVLALQWFIVGLRDHRSAIQGVAVLAAGADRFTLSQPVTILAAPKVTLKSGTIALASSPADGEQEKSAAQYRKALKDGTARLALENTVLEVDLSAYPILVKPSASGIDNSGFAGRTLAPILKALVGHRFRELSLRDTTLLIAAGDDTTYRIDDVQLDIRIDTESVIHLKGAFAFRGALMRVDTRIDGAALKKDPNRVPFTAQVSSDLVKADMDGHFVPGRRPQILAMDSRLKVSSLAQAARWLGLGWPSHKTNDEFAVHGDLNWTGQTIAFQTARFRLGKNSANGTLSLNYGNERPLVEGTLAANNLDVSGYFGEPNETTALSVMPASALLRQFGLSSGSDLISVLRRLDADLRVSAENVIGPLFALGRSAATISLRSGKLLADLAEAELPSGGQGNVQFSFDVNDAVPKIGVRGRMSGIAVSHAMNLAFGTPILTGAGDVSVDLRGDGENRFQFLRTMNGKASVVVPDDCELSLDLPALIERKRTGAPLDKATWVSGQKTACSHVTASVTFEDGVARTDNVSGVVEDVAVTADGTIKFPSRSLDLKISIADHVAGTPPSQDGNAKQTLFHAIGDWANPDFIATDHVDGRASQHRGEFKPKRNPQTSGPRGG